MQWYVARDGKSVGPVEEATMVAYARAGKLAGAMVRDERSPAWTSVEQSPFAGMARSQRAPTKLGWPVSYVIVGVALVAVAILFVVVVAVRSGTSERTTAPAAVTAAPHPAAPRPPPRKPTIQERLSATTRITEAIALLKPSFAAATTETDPAAFLFALWAAKKMTWADLQTVPEAKYAEVMKDPAAEQGKRLCTSGSIVEIEVDRSAGIPIYVGGIMSPSMNVTRYFAVGSTRSLVQNSPGRICGIVTGRFSYANAAGGTTHTVNIVGMFDLPENRTTAPEQGADE